MAVIDGLIYIGGLAALIVFFWGLVKYIGKSGDGDGTAEGRRLMVWGVIGFFVLFSLWGIVAFLQLQVNIRNTGGVENTRLPGFIEFGPGGSPSSESSDGIPIEYDSIELPEEFQEPPSA